MSDGRIVSWVPQREATGEQYRLRGKAETLRVFGRRKVPLPRDLHRSRQYSTHMRVSIESSRSPKRRFVTWKAIPVDMQIGAILLQGAA